jgi:hypothetical protein
LYFQTPQGLLETVIGLDLSEIPREYKDKLYGQDIFQSMKDLSMIPSIVMAILTSRVGILWLLNVLFLICVPASVAWLPSNKAEVSV